MDNFRITALGRRFGLSRSTLLYYDRIGLLRPSGRSEADYRLYSQADCDRLARICAFRAAGVSLDDIARLLDADAPHGPILERRLHEIGQAMTALKAQQQVIAGMLRTTAAGPDAAGLDRTLWLELQHACGLDAAALARWHSEFESRAPAAHHAFLLRLGLSEKEATQVRMLTRNIENNTMSMHYFFELFEGLPRQGPGCEAATLRALRLLEHLPANPVVLDIGCGSGLQTLTLARELQTTILAIDNHPPLLRQLDHAARQAGLGVETREMSMIDMPFPPAHFDLLWAEGSIFIIGLARGLQDFRRTLKPGGYLAFTEMCWFEADPPAEIRAYLGRVYPDIRSMASICALAEASGYALVDSFQLPDHAWWNDYYTPMLARIQALRARNAGIDEAEAVYAACEEEADMHRRYSASYGYGFFVLQKQ